MGISQSNRHRRRPDTDAPDVTPTGFDPGDATVAQVLQYVADHPDQAAAVLAAEQAGRARKGIIDALA